MEVNEEEGIRGIKINKRLNFWMAHFDAVSSVSYIPDKHMILTASVDCSVRLWNADGVYIGCFGQEKPWISGDVRTFTKFPTELIAYYEKTAPKKEVQMKRNVGDLLSFWKSTRSSLHYRDGLILFRDGSPERRRREGPSHGRCEDKARQDCHRKVERLSARPAL